MQTSFDFQPPQHNSLLTGHFFEGKNYATRRERGTQDYLLIYTISGQGRFGFAEEEFVTNAGDFVLLAPGTPHDYATAGPQWELLWMHFLPRPHWHIWLHWQAVSPFTPGLMHLACSDPLLLQHAEMALREAHRRSSGAGRNGDALAMNALENALLWCDAARPRATLVDARVQTAVNFLCENLNGVVDLEKAARAARLSPSRLAHLFKAQVGMTPRQFLEARRLERACQLLSRTGLTVSAISSDVGFDSPFYFFVALQKATGQSPTEYRSRKQGEDASQREMFDTL